MVDRDLVEAAQRGDQAAFVDLVRSRGNRPFAVAHRILRDVDRAEDALQDALVIAWRDLPELRDPGSVRSKLHHAIRAMRAAIDSDARATAVGGSSR